MLVHASSGGSARMTGEALRQLQSSPCGTPVECYQKSLEALQQALDALDSTTARLDAEIAALNSTVTAQQAVIDDLMSLPTAVQNLTTAQQADAEAIKTAEERLTSLEGRGLAVVGGAYAADFVNGVWEAQKYAWGGAELTGIAADVTCPNGTQKIEISRFVNTGKYARSFLCVR
jgi:uncharacterized coiled-coil protein SlyX